MSINVTFFFCVWYNRLTSGDSQASKGLKGLAKPGGRLALQEKHVPVASAAPTEATADVRELNNIN